MIKEIVKEQEKINADLHNREVCKSAIEVFGQANQLIVAMEECSELIQAISKAMRGTDHNVEEEMADVEIMLEQLKFIFDSSKVVEIKKAKLKRLRDMLL